MAKQPLLLQHSGLLLLLMFVTGPSQAFYRPSDSPPRSGLPQHSDTSQQSQSSRHSELQQRGVCTVNATELEHYTISTREYTRCTHTDNTSCSRVIMRRVNRTVTVLKRVCCNGYTNSSGQCVAVCSPSCSNGQICAAPNTCIRAVQLSLGRTIYPNNSVMEMNRFLRKRDPLKCTSMLRPCCGAVPRHYGNWFYPNTTVVPPINSDHLFYSRRGNDGAVGLYWKYESSNHQYQRMKFCCDILDVYEVIQTLCITLAPGDHGGTKPFPDADFAGDQRTPVDERRPPVTVLQAETAPYVGVHSINLVAIVAAVFTVMFGSIMLLVVIVVFGQRRKENQTQNESIDSDYESVKNFSMSDVYDDIVPSPVNSDSFDMSICPVYERQSSETTLSLVSDDFEMTISPLYSPANQPGGLATLPVMVAPADLARASQIQPNTQHE